MAKPTLPFSALMTRAAVLVLGLALFLNRPGPCDAPSRSAGPGVMVTPVYWVSLVGAGFLPGGAVGGVGGVRPHGRRRSIRSGHGPGATGNRLLLDVGAFCAAGAAELVYLIGNRFSRNARRAFDLGVENVTLALVGPVLVTWRAKDEELDRIWTNSSDARARYVGRHAGAPQVARARRRRANRRFGDAAEAAANGKVRGCASKRSGTVSRARLRAGRSPRVRFDAADLSSKDE